MPQLLAQSRDSSRGRQQGIPPPFFEFFPLLFFSFRLLLLFPFYFLPSGCTFVSAMRPNSQSPSLCKRESSANFHLYGENAEPVVPEGIRTTTMGARRARTLAAINSACLRVPVGADLARVQEITRQINIVSLNDGTQETAY